MAEQKLRKRQGGIVMASVSKFTMSAVVNQLRHNERTINHPSNKDLDPTKTYLNYTLSPDRGMSSYDYFKYRKNQLYCYNRSDVKVLVGWIVTAPKTLPESMQSTFFQSTYNFLIKRYGEENCIQAIVHKDESGQPHLHFCFIPVVPDKKHNGEKICANDVINPKELRNFHPDLQKYLKSDGINVNIINGITKAQGGNKTVRTMKREREYERNHIIQRGRWQ